MNKEIKPFKKEFYNLLNLTNLPQRDLQLNGGRGGGIVRGKIGTGGNCPGVIVCGVIVRGGIT